MASRREVILSIAQKQAKFCRIRVKKKSKKQDGKFLKNKNCIEMQKDI